MVLFQADETYFSSSMKTMNKLRQDQSFCDVKLIVGTNSVHAHKCVLAAGSPYFSSLFLGKFTEALMDEINLSEVTDSVSALELILDFVYTGEIDINSKNLGIIVKLSSFFLVETLRNFCMTFMKESLSLHTCLRYYLYALDYGFSNIECNTAQMVKARFHDFLIFEEETLCISPDELMHLVNTSMLEHCTSLNLIQFIAEWVGKGLTERHVTMGTELLDIFNSKGHRLAMNYTEATENMLQNSLERVQLALEKVRLTGQDKFLRRFRQIVSKASFHRQLETKNYNLRVPPSPRSKFEDENRVNAVFCLTPKPHFVEAFEKRNIDHHAYERAIDQGEPVMDLFGYLPNTESWYHVQEFKENVGAVNYLTDEMLWGLWQMGMIKDELLFLNCILDEMSFYNLKTNTWRWMSFGSQIEVILNTSEYCTDFCFTSGPDGSLYLIGKVKVIPDDDDDDGEPRDIIFRGFRLQPNSPDWHEIFHTEIFNFPVNENGIPEMHAKVSSVSNELLFTYVRQNSDEGWNMAFVVNLNINNKATACKKLIGSYQTNGKMLFRGISIMENKSHLFIVNDGTSASGGKVKVKYEYKFKSNHLREVTTSEKIVSMIEPGFHAARNVDNDLYPCWSETSTVDKDTLWYIEGNLNKVSSFTEVTLNRSKNPVIRRHPPPPFSCVTALWAGSVSTNFLEKKIPVSRFPNLKN